MGKRWEWINGVQSVGDVKSRLMRVECGTDCESGVWDKIHNVSYKNLTVLIGDTKMCVLLA